LAHLVGVHGGSANGRSAMAAVDVGHNGIAFTFCSGGQHDFTENIPVLGAFVGNNRTYTTGTDYQNAIRHNKMIEMEEWLQK
jgi:hypothetical protein